MSAWFYANKIRSNQSLPTLSIDEIFESYCDGISPFGSFWDHKLGYLKESMARSHKVLFLKYEDVKENAIFQVNRIANFLGYPFTREEESNKR